MKKKYYGVCGTNAAGIFDDWYKVCKNKDQFVGFKVKSEIIKERALDYIVKIMAMDYKVLDDTQLNRELLLKNTNKIYSLYDLTAPAVKSGKGK